MKAIIIIFLFAGFGCFCTIAYMTMQDVLTVTQFITLSLSGMLTLVIVAAFLSNHLSKKDIDSDILSESYNQQ